MSLCLFFLTAFIFSLVLLRSIASACPALLASVFGGMETSTANYLAGIFGLYCYMCGVLVASVCTYKDRSNANHLADVFVLYCQQEG